MAEINVTPSQANLTISMNGNDNTATSPQIKLVPLNPDGTIYDCSAINGATLQFAAPTAASPSSVFAQAMTVGTADATGVVVSLTPADSVIVAGKMTQQNAKACITATNGTDTGNFGNVNLRLDSILPVSP
jgi:hypothetical protein